MRISDWSSDVCSSDLIGPAPPIDDDAFLRHPAAPPQQRPPDGDETAGEDEIHQRQRDQRREDEDEEDTHVPLALFSNPFVSSEVETPIGVAPVRGAPRLRSIRSEEHTSELQSLMRISYAVFCL